MSRSLLDSPEQIQMRKRMRSPIINTLKAFSALALLSASCLSAQSGVTIIANVPFDFVASYRDFPIGTYTLTSDLDLGICCQDSWRRKRPGSFCPAAPF